MISNYIWNVIALEIEKLKQIQQQFVLYLLSKFETNTIFKKLTVLGNEMICKLSNQRSLGAWFQITLEMLSLLRYKTANKFNNTVRYTYYPNLKQAPFFNINLKFLGNKMICKLQNQTGLGA